MKTIFIPIKRSTIRKNPNYHIPGTMKFLPGSLEFRFKIESPDNSLNLKKMEEQLEELGLLLTSYTQSLDGTTIEGVSEKMMTTNSMEYCFSIFPNIVFSFSRKVIDITSMEEDQKVLYETKDVKITCPNCHSTFNHTYLNDSIEGDDGYYCPVCDEQIEIELEFEKLEDIPNIEKYLK